METLDFSEQTFRKALLKQLENIQHLSAKDPRGAKMYGVELKDGGQILRASYFRICTNPPNPPSCHK